MEIDKFRTFCLSLPETTEELPFGPDTLVFKVNHKMFALTDINFFKSINLKCDPDKAVELRDRYEEVIPGYHMNKRHWNTVSTQGSLPDRLLQEWIITSYRLVIAKMPQKDRARITQKLKGNSFIISLLDN